MILHANVWLIHFETFEIIIRKQLHARLSNFLASIDKRCNVNNAAIQAF